MAHTPRKINNDIIPLKEEFRAYRHRLDLKRKVWIYDPHFRPGSLSVKLNCNVQEFLSHLRKYKVLKEWVFEIHVLQVPVKRFKNMSISRIFFYVTLKSDADLAAFMFYCSEILPL